MLLLLVQPLAQNQYFILPVHQLSFRLAKSSLDILCLFDHLLIGYDDRLGQLQLGFDFIKVLGLH